MEYISVKQAANRLGISRQAVLKRINAGRIPAVKVGKAYIIDADDLQKG